MRSLGTAFGQFRGTTIRSLVLVVATTLTGALASNQAAQAESVEPGRRFTTSWGDLQSARINPSSGKPEQRFTTDPNSHRYRDRGGEINFENDRRRFERKDPDGTVLRLRF